MLLPQEGTTQGDPLAMMMFALATVPLIHTVQTKDTMQVWFADDAAAGGRIRLLCLWWDALKVAQRLAIFRIQLKPGYW